MLSQAQLPGRLVYLLFLDRFLPLSGNFSSLTPSLGCLAVCVTRISVFHSIPPKVLLRSSLQLCRCLAAGSKEADWPTCCMQETELSKKAAHPRVWRALIGSFMLTAFSAFYRRTKLQPVKLQNMNAGRWSRLGTSAILESSHKEPSQDIRPALKSTTERIYTPIFPKQFSHVLKR